MVNKSKARGTSFENKVVAYLRPIFGPEVDRAKANNPASDIYGTPFTVECKKRARWDIPAWARTQKGHGRTRWALFVAPSDSRPITAPPEVVVLPVPFALELLAAWNDRKAS